MVLDHAKKSANEEIEIKVHLEEEGLAHLRTWLQEHASFQREENQQDCYLDNPTNTWFLTHEAGYRYALKYLRVRFTDAGSSICFKDWTQSSARFRDGFFCQEIECDVSSGEQALLLFQALGFTDITEFSKHRLVYTSHGIEIAIDTVKNLGTFIEFEVKERQYDSQEQEHERLKRFIKETIGITQYKHQKQGFIIHLWNPGFDFEAP